MPDIVHSITYAEEGSSIDGLAPLGAKPESLAQVVYAAVRKAIVSKALRPGADISETSVARRLSVSKTPVREALLRLQAVGLVEPDGRGLRIVLPSERAIHDAYETRVVLESGLSRWVAEHATEAHREVIAEAAAQSLESASAANIDGFRAWDRTFHQSIANATENPRLEQLAEDAAALAGVLRDRDVPGVQDAIRCARQHLEIAAAINQGNCDAAAACASKHAADVREMVLAAFRQRTAPD
ncbi:MAG: GntR family transcriptional regulator [Streptosporangiaceae bacterium]